jgi:orotidine-5'-phosphate decarboxylase
MSTALQKLEARVAAVHSLVCVGLDSELAKLPTEFRLAKFPQFEFNKKIINDTHQYVTAYKPNLAFYEAQGEQGLHELKLTMEYLQSEHPQILTIADAKRADIGNTNLGYVQALFDELKFDAVTLHPYLGKEALQPFLERTDKLNIILCRTSNPGAPEFQDLKVSGTTPGQLAKPLWQVVAEKVSRDWNKSKNCALVVGATYPEEVKVVREIDDTMWLLVPGIGAQGGDLQAVLENGLNKQKTGLIINSGRSIIFANEPEKAAELLHQQISTLRHE